MASVAFVGALPAVALEIVRVPGFPETDMESIDEMVYVTVAVAVVAASIPLLHMNNDISIVINKFFKNCSLVLNFHLL